MKRQTVERAACYLTAANLMFSLLSYSDVWQGLSIYAAGAILLYMGARR